MKALLSITTLFFIITSCSSQKKLNMENWQSLVSNNTNGWHTYGKTYAGKAWSVNNNVLYFNPSVEDQTQRGDLVTNEIYENFHLKYEWKISKNGNSGVIFNVNDDATKYQYPYLTGPEMQVLDNSGHPDAKIFKHRAGDLYDLIASKPETVKPSVEWNAAEIILNNGKLAFFLNGKKVVSTIMWDNNWKKMVAGSKFKDMPDFGKSRSGKIVLQDHGDEVWYKNIVIKKL
ncbi:DUF1080 domain-containing protein [Pedobacter cryophilus]|uniref:DUF1080 domain-containing protein n=2 Tax=Pedobacter cryophilus TaxID=2571271 RepID=A0A4U1C3T3_9SPHI|nr:DUF1080 domain-containing protein [Pedobacter cryophilus]